jgi:hypothetical protein
MFLPHDNLHGREKDIFAERERILTAAREARKARRKKTRYRVKKLCPVKAAQRPKGLALTAVE